MELSNRGRNRNKIWRKGSLGDEDDARPSNTHKCTHSAEKSRDTTLDSEVYDVRYRDWGRPIGKTMTIIII